MPHPVASASVASGLPAHAAPLEPAAMGPAAMSPADMERLAGEASELLRALANEKRLLVLCHLLDGEHSVGELMGLVGMNQSALSQQLARLRALRLVATRRSGQTIHYRLASAEVARILQTLHGIYCAPAARRA